MDGKKKKDHRKVVIKKLAQSYLAIFVEQSRLENIRAMKIRPCLLRGIKVSFNFMAADTICSDFGAPKCSLSVFPLFPHLFAMK